MKVTLLILVATILRPPATTPAEGPVFRPDASFGRPHALDGGVERRPLQAATDLKAKGLRIAAQDNPVSPPSARAGAGNGGCASAIAVDVPSVTSGSSIGGVLDPRTGPACGTTITIGGAWFSVIGTGNTMTATTCPTDRVQPGDADYNTKISVFCGTCTDLSCVTGNDNGCGFFFESTVSWCADAGVEYLILVHGDDEQGTFDLSVYDDGVPCDDFPDCTPPPSGACCFPDAPCLDADEIGCVEAGGAFLGEGTECRSADCGELVPENDECVGALQVAVPSLTEGSTVFAGTDAAESCSIFVQSPGVWYQVEGTGNKITATTCSGDSVQPGSGDFDTAITVYCGDCNASDCCGPHQGTGCDDPACEAGVCAVDPFCCNSGWDSLCAAQALVHCSDLCTPVFCVDDNDDACDTGFLQSTVSWCSEAGRNYWILVHGIEATGAFTLSVYDDGAPCEAYAICDACVFECKPGAIVEDEPDCGLPEDATNGGCNYPIGLTSDCCVPHSGTGCDDGTCAATVCDFDPFCCDVVWDPTCAAAALQVCGVCAGATYLMTPIESGQTHCATAASTGGVRDTDWYRLVLEQEKLVEVRVTAGFQAVAGILDTGGIESCIGLAAYVNAAVVTPCQTTSVFARLPAGTWYILVLPAGFDPVQCETAYELSVFCTVPGACCFENGDCFQRGEQQCALDGGHYLGPGTDCFTPDEDPSSYTSQPNLEIPDGHPLGVSDAIVVGDTFPVSNVAVDLRVDHPSVGTLTVTLTHEDSGTTATLWNDRCEGWINLDVTIEDGGDPVFCDSPTTGVFDPLEAGGSPLSVFQGLDASGSWRLRIADNVSPNAGTLLEWTLNLDAGTPVDCKAPSGACCDPCPGDCAGADGVADTLDLMNLLDQWGTAGQCDINGDMVVGINDLLSLLRDWGPCDPCEVTTAAACDSVGGVWTQGADCTGNPCN